MCERPSGIPYHIPGTRIFGSKFLEYLRYSSMWGMWCLEYPSFTKMKNWSELGILDFSWSGEPPPSPDLCGTWCVETNHCIPLGYRLIIRCCQYLCNVMHLQSNVPIHSMYFYILQYCLEELSVASFVPGRCCIQGFGSAYGNLTPGYPHTILSIKCKFYKKAYQ